MKTETTAPALTVRLYFLESISEDRFAYVAGQVAEVPASRAAELVRTRQAEVTTRALRTPVWATCCGTSWIPVRVLDDGRVVPRWTDTDAGQPPAYTECHRCRRGWLL